MRLPRGLCPYFFEMYLSDYIDNQYNNNPSQKLMSLFFCSTWEATIEDSFLSKELQQLYLDLLHERFERIKA